jgi:hypothetical protein
MRMSPSLRPHLDASAFGGAWLRVPHGFRLFKLLLHYDWAWWRSLGLLDGPFSANRCGKDTAFCPLCTCDQSLPLAGRCERRPQCCLCPAASCLASHQHRMTDIVLPDTVTTMSTDHDAHVTCDDGNQTGFRCRGFLQTVYTSDGSSHTAVSAWESFAAGGTSPPHQRFTNSSGADSAWLLQYMHAQLIEAHRAQLQGAGLLAQALAAPPTEAILLLWDPKTEGSIFMRSTSEMTQITLRFKSFPCSVLFMMYVLVLRLWGRHPRYVSGQGPLWLRHE